MRGRSSGMVPEIALDLVRLAFRVRMMELVGVRTAPESLFMGVIAASR